MSTLKNVRELKRLMHKQGIKVEHEIDNTSHVELTVTHVDGRVQKLKMACSPKIDGVSIEVTARKIRHFAERRYESVG